MRRRGLGPVALLGLAALMAQPAAALADTVTHQRVVTPFTFTLDAGNCPQIPVAVSGSGNYVDEINTRTLADGTIEMVDNSLAIGTATDVLGNVYHFNYHNHTSRDIAPGGFPIDAMINYHFNLLGHGPDSGYDAGFVIRVIRPAPGQRIQMTINTRGSGCDPI